MNDNENLNNQNKPEMKESGLILVVIMAIVFGFAAIANTDRQQQDEQVQIVPCEIGIYKLAYLKKSPDEIKVTVFDAEGNEVMVESIETNNGFVREYDLKKHGSDQYTFRIKDCTGQVDHLVYFDVDLNLTVFQLGETGKYKLMARDMSSDMEIKFYNDKGQLLLSDEVKARGNVNKTFDLSKIIEPGDEVSFRI